MKDRTLEEARQDIGEDALLKGSFVSVLLVGAFILIAWLGVFCIYLARA
jgi:hypothetical protein